MNPLSRLLALPSYPHRTRVVPPAEPPDLPKPERERIAEEIISARAQMPEVPKWRWCRACDVKWHGLPGCWVCGKTVAGI